MTGSGIAIRFNLRELFRKTSTYKRIIVKTTYKAHFVSVILHSQDSTSQEILVEVLEGQPDSADGEHEERPGDDAFEVVKAGSPREQRVTRTVEPGERK